MTTDWKPGDVVILKSGGPMMTVFAVGDYTLSSSGLNPGVLCVWFNKGQRTEAVFHPNSITKYEPAEVTFQDTDF